MKTCIVSYTDHLKAYQFRMFLTRFKIKSAITQKWREHMIQYKVPPRTVTDTI